MNNCCFCTTKKWNLSFHRFVHCGGTISRTLKVLYLWWTVTIETVLLRQEMSCIECWMRCAECLHHSLTLIVGIVDFMLSTLSIDLSSLVLNTTIWTLVARCDYIYCNARRMKFFFFFPVQWKPDNNGLYIIIANSCASLCFVGFFF